ncbi:MAG TPA: methyltransferase domain-containing protein [Zeimonas sp.]|nr:methyltransferase domain-containing protein [Zeimonas sp.]
MNLRTLVKRSFVASCAYYLKDDMVAALRFRSGNLDTTSGMAHGGRDTGSSVAYIEQVFADYKRYSGVSRFQGRVAEVGPGDNAGVGLMFLADGCESVDLVDRFYSRRSAARNAEIYKSLVERHRQLAARLDGDGPYDDANFRGIRRCYGEQASAEGFFSSPAAYDYIVSRAVMEHVRDPVLAFRRMSAALKPGGMLLHKVDLRDHGMFSGAFHELKFLEVPDWLYPAMTRGSGRPNRKLVHSYREVLEQVLPDHDILVTRLAAVGDIEPHARYEQIDSSSRRAAESYVESVRGRFCKALRNVASADLAVTGIFIVGRKAGGRP